MFDNADKIPLQQSLNQLVSRALAAHARAKGKALPCRVVAINGSLVQVAFEVSSKTVTFPLVWMPKAESQWIRMPTQVGDFGVTVPADAYLSGISNMGGSTAQIEQQPGNLSALVFVPVASAAFAPVDTNAAYISGPDGAVIQTQDGSAKITVGKSGIVLNFGGKTVTLNGNGLTIDGILFDSHVHGGVQGGDSFTGGPQS